MTFPAHETALLLVDPLNEFLAEGGKLWPLTRGTAEKAGTIKNLERLVPAARAAGLTIAYALHHASAEGDYANWQFLNPSHVGTQTRKLFEKDSFGARVLASVAPQPGDLVAQEHWTASGFANTDLDFLLKQHGIRRLVIVGNRANTCIDATGRYAVELGYQAVLISDAIAAFSDAEMAATIDVNWPAFGHGVLTTDAFLAQLTNGETTSG